MKKNKKKTKCIYSVYKLRANTFATLTSIGVILQIQAINSAMVGRGRFAVGGEWLVLPLIYLLYILIMEVSEVFK